MKSTPRNIIAATMLILSAACAKLPPAEQVKADLIGQVIGNWRFDSPSEFQEFTVTDRGEQGDVAEYKISVLLKDSKQQNYKADLTVNYRKQDGNWVFASVTDSGTFGPAAALVQSPKNATVNTSSMDAPKPVGITKVTAFPASAELATKMLIGETWTAWTRLADESDAGISGTITYKDGGLADATYSGGRKETDISWKVKMINNKIYLAEGTQINLPNDSGYETQIVELTAKTLIVKTYDMKYPMDYVRSGAKDKDFIIPKDSEPTGVTNQFEP